ESSSVDIGSSLIACCSDGVRISFWTSFVCSFCWMPMRRFRRIAQSNRRYAILTPILVQSEVSPQVNPSDLLVGRQTVRGPAPKNHTPVDDVGPIGDPQRLADVVIRNQHPDAPFLQVKNDLLHV